jgi:CRP-like cAMP-binding protein
MVAVSEKVCIQNKILGALPHDELARILPHVVSIQLERGEVVYLPGDRIRYVYFPSDGLFSLRCTCSSGSTVEVAMVGNEGIVGLPVIQNEIIPYEVTAQVRTLAYRIRAEQVQEEFSKGGVLQRGMLLYLNMLIAEISQSSVCYRFHTLERALSRWLLITQDRLSSSCLNITHENISQALGVPRTGVTTAAGSLQRAGLIRYSRGKIVILDRAGLEENACECFRIVHDGLKHFLKDLAYQPPICATAGSAAYGK